MMELWTPLTPNGWKVSIMLEELISRGRHWRRTGAHDQSTERRPIQRRLRGTQLKF